MEIVFLLAMVVLPMLIGDSIAKKRNRSRAKVAAVVFFFGWIGLCILAAFLKTRDISTGFLK